MDSAFYHPMARLSAEVLPFSAMLTLDSKARATFLPKEAGSRTQMNEETALGSGNGSCAVIILGGGVGPFRWFFTTHPCSEPLACLGRRCMGH